MMPPSGSILPPRGVMSAQAFEAAVSLHRQGHLREAEHIYRAILGVDSDHLGCLHYLGVIHISKGLPDRAIELIQRAIELKPDLAEPYIDLGIALAALGRFEEAAAHTEIALRLKPDFAVAHNNLGSMLEALGRHEDAIVHCETALALKPDYGDAENNLANALAALGRSAEAIEHYSRAIAFSPGSAGAHSNLGKLLQADGRSEEAIECFRKSLAIRSCVAETHCRLATSLLTLGQHPAAREALETAVALAPGKALYHRLLAESKQFVPGDSHLAAMEAMAADMAALTEDNQTELRFALGKAYADMGEHERSFRHIIEGNALAHKRAGYDEPAILGLFDRTKITFDFDLMRRNQGVGHQSPVPVFIIGMPRSGTSLVEQILASHPQVFGAGELTDMTRAVDALAAKDGDSSVFPEVVSRMTRGQIYEFGERYLSSVQAMARPGAVRITDKMPDNFRWLGLIHLALPNARFIHTRRDAVDTCLSCFSKLFDNLPYTYNLAELGRYYNAYAALMEHWGAVLPPGIVLDVQYEELVADFERQARRIVDFCALEWDPHCFAFHETQRPVRTASALQVRRPIYKDSVGRSKRYQMWLDPLLHVLGNESAAPSCAVPVNCSASPI